MVSIEMHSTGSLSLTLTPHKLHCNYERLNLLEDRAWWAKVYQQCHAFVAWYLVPTLQLLMDHDRGISTTHSHEHSSHYAFLNYDGIKPCGKIYLSSLPFFCQVFYHSYMTITNTVGILTSK